MGEAKRKLEELRASLLKELAQWEFPPSEWEAEVVQEIERLPKVTVRRYPADALAYMRMPPRQCHKNARFMEDNDPDGKVRHIAGWWPQEGKYVLHSVIDQDGTYACVTPVPMATEDTFEFIPDDKIEWHDEDDLRIPYRDGTQIPVGVRPDPLQMINEIKLLRERLLTGMNPYEALRRMQ